MAEYDLTPRLTPFFDLHLVIPLLEFIEPRKVCRHNHFCSFEIHQIFFRFMMNIPLLKCNVKLFLKPT